MLPFATASTANETGKETNLAIALDDESPKASNTNVLCHFVLFLCVRQPFPFRCSPLFPHEGFFLTNSFSTKPRSVYPKFNKEHEKSSEKSNELVDLEI